MPRLAFSSIWTQFFPPSPQSIDAHVPLDLQGKVYIVTGANSGIGEEVARILYSRAAKVYVAARSEQKAREAISRMKESSPEAKGELTFLLLDLADLNNVKAAAQIFLANESKLHVLFNNAGVMVGPTEPPLKTVQGYELALGVNCVGTFLFTKLLIPKIISTAASEPANTVRVVWLSSFGLGEFAPEGRGVDMDNLDFHSPKPHVERYGISKCGVWLLGVEFGRRHKVDGIVSAPINPGNLRSALGRDQKLGLRILAYLLCYPPINGAYTQLFAAFASDVAIDRVDWTKDWGKLNLLQHILSYLFILVSFKVLILSLL